MLKKIALTKRRSTVMAALKQLENKRSELRSTQKSIEAEVERADDVTDELMQKVNDVEASIKKNTEDLEALQTELDDINAEIEAIDDGDDGDDPTGDGHRSVSHPQSRSVTLAAASRNYRSRSRCFASRVDCESFYQRSEVKEFLQRVRSLASEKRSVTGAELNIPVVMLDLIRDNLGEYSKLIGKVNLRPIKGQARQNVLGNTPEAVWTEMRGALNELEFAFTQIELDGYKLGGFIPIDNSDLRDSDVNLGEEIMTQLLRAIGKALDKAVAYGKGPGSKMPVGFVTRLAETAQPAYWGESQGDWTDLHSSHVMALNIFANTGEAFFRPLLEALAKCEPDYARGGKTTWIMNRKTHMDIIARGLAFNAAGALVSGINSTMPVENGEIIEDETMSDYDIAGGYLDLYLMSEREGGTVSQSEHVKFIEDKTLFKGVARYDGKPVRGEAFVIVNYNNTAPATSKDFVNDYANVKTNTLICTAAAGSANGNTCVTVAGAINTPAVLKYKAQATNDGIKVGDKVNGYTALSSGTTQITAVAGCPIAVVELDAAGCVISTGTVLAVPKA